MRSAIPKVVGILMIIFASVGLLFTVIGLLTRGVNNELFEGIPAYHRYMQITLVFGLVGAGVGVVHLMAGLAAVRYRQGAPRLTMIYGVLNIVQAIINAIIMFAWLKPAMEEALKREMGHTGMDVSAIIGVSVVFGVILSFSWPTVAMILMTRPAAKAACTN
jgi:hypothetical protein